MDQRPLQTIEQLGFEADRIRGVLPSQGLRRAIAERWIDSGAHRDPMREIQPASVDHRFDEIVAGYDGRLYVEIVPRSFAIRVRTGLSLNQMRLMVGNTRLSDEQLRTVHQEFPLLYLDSHPLRESELAVADGLFLSVD